MKEERMDALKLSQIVSDEYQSKILLGTADEPKSAVQLSREFRIPMAACYRRIRRLEKEGLLTRVDKVPSRRGKKISIYSSQIKNIYTTLENGKINVTVEFIDGRIVDLD